MENSSGAEGGGGTLVGGGGNSGGTEEQTPQLFCLRWNNYQSNLTNVFDQLLQNESFVDVTLACADGHSVKAHKMVLSACSPYFQALFFENPCKHPIVILKDIKWTELKAAVEFMYKGEINVCQEQIGPLLKVAESLKIRGLADVSNEHDFSSATDRKSPTMAAATATTTTAAASMMPIPAETNRSPTRNSSTIGMSIPSRKRRRTSADRSSSNATEETISVINSPSRALELITSPSSSMGNATPLSTCGGIPIGPSGSCQQGSSQSGNRPSQSSTPQSPPNTLPLPPSSATIPSTSSVADDVDIKPGIAEMIREEERAKMLESSQAWLNASTSSLTYYQPSSLMAAAGSQSQIPTNTAGSVSLKLKAPTWTQSQLKEAIQAVVTQQMRFTQASVHFGIPKGTLYDNILGKTKRMQALDEAGLTSDEETAVLEFCCQISASPYNRRTRKSLSEVLNFVQGLRQTRDPSFEFTGLAGFRWWWAFCKKHSIVSLHFSSNSNGTKPASSSQPPDQAGGGSHYGGVGVAALVTDNEEPYDFSTRDVSKQSVTVTENVKNQNAFTGYGSLQEYLKLSVESSLTSFASGNEANKFSAIQEIHAKTSPICH